MFTVFRVLFKKHILSGELTFKVYYRGSKSPVFFVANRGHHADIGGLVPGSMPPHSTSLSQVGKSLLFKKYKDVL